MQCSVSARRRVADSAARARASAVAAISPRLLSLLDYFLHKAPYWSVNNYEKRLSEGVREGFMQHVLKAHKESWEDLNGSNGEFELSN